MTDYKYLIEKPSKEDLFDGGSHSRISSSVYKTLNDDNGVNVVGIEGPLGSGKSSVVEIIKEQSADSDYEFIEFDVERFQHGATKRALIETIYDGIKSKVKKHQNIKKAKDVALGNHFEYTSNVNSNISIWIVLFVFLLLASSRVIPDALAGISSFLEYMFKLCTKDNVDNYTINTFAIISTFIALSPIYIIICSRLGLNTLIFWARPPSLGNIFKRNSIDKITETIEINKEVGAYELQQALQIFTDEIPNDVKFILVVDNLDRVTDEKLREVWSDIEVFSSIADKKIQLLIPFSKRHVAKALSNTRKNGDNTDVLEGLEFITKRIPVTFRVSPIVSADWKKQFEVMLSDSSIDLKESDIQKIVKLISIWSDTSTQQITPRYLKKLINSVVSILLTNDNPVSVVNSFFYQLAVQENLVLIDAILIEEMATLEAPDIITSKVNKSLKLLSKTMDFNDRAKELISIHFQTTYDIAESELLLNPLLKALENCDFTPFVEKQDIYGYNKIFKEILNENSTESITEIIYGIKKEDNKNCIKWLNEWLPSIQIAIKDDNNTIEDIMKLVEIYLQLKELGINLNLNILEKEYSSRDLSVDKILNNKPEYEFIVELHSLSKFLNKTPEIVKHKNAKLFVNYLWPYSSELKHWKIASTKFNEETTKDILKIITSSESPDYNLLSLISSSYEISWSQQEDKLSYYIQALTSIADITTITNIIDINIHCSFWYEDLSHDYYQILNQFDENNDLKTKWVAQAFANMIYNSQFTYLKRFTDALDDETLKSEFFLSHLTNYLAISCEMDNLITALENNQIEIILQSAIKRLINDERIDSLDIQEVIKKYSTFQKIQMSDTELLNWLHAWEEYDQISHDNIANINNDFTTAIFNTETKWKNKFIKIINNTNISEGFWLEQIKKPSSNIKTIIEKLAPYSLNACANLTSAIKNLFTDRNKQFLSTFTNTEWISSLLIVLPERSKGGVIATINKVLNERHVSSACQISIIENFGNNVRFYKHNDIESQTHCITLFEQINNQKTANWFDNIEYDFSEWDSSELNTFVHYLMQHNDKGLTFTTLNKNDTIRTIKESIDTSTNK